MPMCNNVCLCGVTLPVPFEDESAPERKNFNRPLIEV